MAICDFCCATAVLSILLAIRARLSPYLYYCPPRIIDDLCNTPK
ncbi:hypothetical protein HMPREF1577_00879 [Gardnerella pickettii JCP8017A]|uniref:Uncharacterized protein n=1 Tax=Gardnerella pickettii JCP8017A TaxID=1261062 RepID=T2PKE5_9BIFI|nr:hypothetical protein HMPREF1577_00879 [Gardnerella pickettii JCP8017A]EPI61620.1 hypothetical protein HMPREF1578_00825 [Gardnerella pickettii JCP8017B]